MSDELKLTNCELALEFVADSSVGMGLVDSDGIFTDVNAAYCKILNAPKELIIGKHFKTFTHHDDVELDSQFAPLRLACRK